MSNWFSISIKQGQAIIAANTLDPVDREIAILVALYGKDTEYYENLPRYKLLQKIKRTSWINNLPDSRYARPLRNGNHLYKFKTHPNQLSQSDFALLQKYGQDYVQNLHKILAILSTKFTIFPPREASIKDHSKEHAARAELFLNKMPFGLAYAYALFFSTYYPHLLEVGQAYSQGQQRAAKEYLQNNPTP